MAMEIDDDVREDDVRVTIRPNHLTVRIKGSAEGLDGKDWNFVARDECDDSSC